MNDWAYINLMSPWCTSKLH